MPSAEPFSMLIRIFLCSSVRRKRGDGVGLRLSRRQQDEHHDYGGCNLTPQRRRL
jgi:hypothetical protein